ncbi:threonine/serine dehydratase [Paraburkholderia aspalathi]|nr:threonine/serine dehydratase [Paraburkholderia aspalathi]
MISIDDIRQAERRIEGKIRRTPIIKADNFSTASLEGINLTMKLELLQVTGSFKARGATNRLLNLEPSALKNGIVTASGGNHGLGTARAGRMAGVPTTIFLPTNAAPSKLAKLEQWGANIRVVGDSFSETNAVALEFAAQTGAAYFHPFADPDVVAGQGTLGLEILSQMDKIDTVLVAIGGGGLISGISTVFKALAPHVRVVGIEAAGSASLLKSVEAGVNITLDSVTTQVATMSCARTDDRIFDIVRRNVDEIVLVDDAEMKSAAEWLWFEMGLAADLSGAAAIAALREGRVKTRPGENICAIICGAGPEAIIG